MIEDFDIVDKQQTYNEFFRMLSEHDWYYHYSDDFKYFKNGSDSARNIQYYIKHNDNCLGTLQTLYSKYSKAVQDQVGDGALQALKFLYYEEYTSVEN